MATAPSRRPASAESAARWQATTVRKLAERVRFLDEVLHRRLDTVERTCAAVERIEAKLAAVGVQGQVSSALPAGQGTNQDGSEKSAAHIDDERAEVPVQGVEPLTGEEGCVFRQLLAVMETKIAALRNLIADGDHDLDGVVATKESQLATIKQTFAASVDLQRDDKGKFSSLALDSDNEMKAVTESSNQEELPIGDIVFVGSERFRCPEVVSQPSFLGKEASGIHDTKSQCIEQCEKGDAADLPSASRKPCSSHAPSAVSKEGKGSVTSRVRRRLRSKSKPEL